ncbi:MAG: protein phosphatase 2C domain-containing protein [Candidatus Pacebacteria bacterium]|nr:protein phosphatase 2C domain-containing protein [Candidatus Paceibacterota bacterium]
MRFFPKKQQMQSGRFCIGSLPKTPPPDIAAETHVGNARHTNEDSFLVACLPGGSAALAAVADGIGGEEAGEIASYFTLRYVLEEWLAAHRANRLTSMTGARKAFIQGLDKANWFLGTINSRFGGKRFSSGSTIVAVIVGRTKVCVAHAGDSRCYGWRHNTFVQLTKDHTEAQRLADYGEITHDKVAGHSAEHLLSNCVGMAIDMHVSVQEWPLRAGDQFLLCSDGVTKSLKDDDIGVLLHEAGSARAAVTDVIGTSLSKQAHDNVTAAVVFV